MRLDSVSVFDGAMHAFRQMQDAAFRELQAFWCKPHLLAAIRDVVGTAAPDSDALSSLDETFASLSKCDSGLCSLLKKLAAALAKKIAD